jgi:mannose-6-phosphate isomerase-like protein (cupin superfamily)
MSGKVNLQQAFGSFDELWQPHAAADVDAYQLKIAKIDGEFVWHAHDDADELFLVHAGHLTLRLRDQAAVELDPGELYVVRRGVEHQPVGRDGCQIVMFERAEVVNTGNAGGGRTVAVRSLD